MSIGINAKQDTSYLFSGLNTGAGRNGMADLTNLLGDYASIKSGSYGKLLKAYYSPSASKEVSSLASHTQEASKEEKTALAKVQTSSDELKEAADKLYATGKNSVFNKVDSKYDQDSIFSAVDSFVNKYNAALKAASDSGTASVSSRLNSLAGNVIANAKSLSKIGISVNEDSSLKLDKDSFMKADMSNVQTLFQGAGSFGYQASAQASMLNFAAENAANSQSNYTADGTFFNQNAGALFNTYF